MLSAEFLQARKNGLAYSAIVDVVDIDVNDTAMLIRNTSSYYHLCIERTFGHTDVETKIDVQCPSDTTTALVGTAVTPASLNRNYSETAPCTIKGDETALAKGTVVDRIYAYADSFPAREYNGAIELGTNQSVGFDWITEPTETQITVWFYFVRR